MHGQDAGDRTGYSQKRVGVEDANDGDIVVEIKGAADTEQGGNNEQEADVEKNEIVDTTGKGCHSDNKSIDKQHGQCAEDLSPDPRFWQGSSQSIINGTTQEVGGDGGGILPVSSITEGTNAEVSGHGGTVCPLIRFCPCQIR